MFLWVFAYFFVTIRPVIALFGSRWLIRNGIPSVGQFAPWPSLRGLLGASFSEWRSSGLGVGAPAPPGTYLLAGVSALFVGQAGLAQTVSTLALLPLGAFGVWRLSNLLSSSESRPVPGGGDVAETSSGDREADDDPQGVLSAKVVATAAYLVAPVFYDGLVAGRFDALVAYGLLPWLLHRFLRSRTAPTKSHRAGVVTEAAFLGVPLALMVALAPTLTPLIVVVVLGWSAGSVVAGTPVHAKMFLRRFALGALGAMVLLAPWVGDLLFGSRTHLSLLTGGDQATNSHLRLFDIIRMAGGDVGRSPSSWAFAGLAILPLFVADDARFRNAVRAWVMTLLCVTLIWAVGRGWFPAVIPNEHVMFVAVGLGFALAIGLGVAGVQHDARSRSFGWRQSFGLMASAGIVVLAVPVLLSAGSGRWNLPERTMASDLRWLNDQVTEGGYRVVWLGSPRVLPAAGWRMEPDLAFSASDDGLPSVLGMYGARSTPALQRVLAYLGDARDHRTARLGASLAPYAIRYIVVLERPWENGPLSGIPPDFRSALLGQLDLRQLEVAPGALLLENTEWVPTYAAVPGRPQAVDGSVSVDLSGAQPVLLSSRSEKQLIDDAAVGLDDPEQALENAEARHHDVVAGSELRGRVPPISTLTVAVAADRRWRATGATLDSSPVMLATGTMAFAPTGVRTTDGAPAIGAESSIDVVALEYQSPPVRRFLRVVVGALWLICLLVLIRSRRRHRRSRDLRLLAADRLLQAEDVSSAFGESLGWYADDTDGDDPIVDVPGGVAERVGLRSPQPIGGGRRGASPPATSPIAATTLDDGSVDAPSEASLADALWDTWSRRREERDDPRR